MSRTPDAEYDGSDKVRVIRMGEELEIERWEMQLGDIFYHEGKTWKVIDIGGTFDGKAEVLAEGI